MGYSKRGSVGWGENLYIIWCPEAGVVKIGRSCNCERRFKQISLSCPFLHMELTATFPSSGWAEAACHRALHDKSCGKEWFRISREEAVNLVNSILTLP